MVFENRQQAGNRLGRMLKRLKGRDVVVMGLPRGGVVVADQVARHLDAPLGVLLVCKISHPYSPEFAVGAIAEDDGPIYSEQDIVAIDPLWLKLEEEGAHELIDQRRDLYYGHAGASPDLNGKIVVLVDDGIATGLTMSAAVQNVTIHGALRVVIASPVASREGVARLRKLTDDIVVLEDVDNFLGAIGAHYQHYDQVDDLQVRLLLLNHVRVLK